MNALEAMLRDERGAAVTEYALVLALLSLAAITALSGLGAKIGAVLINLAQQLSSGQTGP